MTIQKLQALDMSKVQPEALQTAVQDILDDYKSTSDKVAFKDIAKENIEKVYLLVERLAPKAIIKEDIVKKSSVGKSTVKKELETLNEDIKACRVKIRSYNEEKRKNSPKKPKPTRHSKIKKHFLSIANLIPPEHKDNLEVQTAAEKVLLLAHRGIMNAYKMNTLRAKDGEKAIKDKYNELEEKAKQ